MKKKILITGGTGLVGTILTEFLLKKGYEVTFLSRTEGVTKKGVQKYKWDVDQNYIDDKAFEGITDIIHLAGTGVADKRWSKKHKKNIYESRITATKLLFNKVKELNISINSLICASAIGIYGMSEDDTLFTEKSQYAEDFLAKVTVDWETEMDRFSQIGTRVVKLRIGLVLSDQGGALVKLVEPVKWGAGAALGTGKQYMSWIHIHDLANMFITSLEDSSYEGAYNAVASKPVTNLEMTKVIAKVLNKPLFLPNVPTFALKIIIGEMANLVVTGLNISNQKIKNQGFTLKYEDLEKTLIALLKKQ